MSALRTHQENDIKDVEEVGEEVDRAEVGVARLVGGRRGHALLSRHLCNRKQIIV